MAISFSGAIDATKIVFVMAGSAVTPYGIVCASVYYSVNFFLTHNLNF